MCHSKITVFIIAGIVGVVVNMGFPMATDEILPKIFLTHKDPPEFDFWYSPKVISFKLRLFADGGTYGQSIRLTCNSSVPIDWDFSGTFINRVNNFSRERIVSLSDSNDFHRHSDIFQIHVTIHKKDVGSSGLYICKSLQDPSIYDSVHVLTRLQRRIRAMTVRPKRLDQTTVLLPCPADATPLSASLNKYNMTQTRINITSEQYVSYNLTEGFTLDLTKYNESESLWGTYECQLQYLSTWLPESIHITLQKPRKYIYSPDDGQFDTPTEFQCASMQPVEIRDDAGRPYPNVTYFKNSKPYVYNAIGLLDHISAGCFDNWANERLKYWRFYTPEPLVSVIGEYSEAIISCEAKTDYPVRMVMYECDVPAQCNFLKKCLEDNSDCEQISFSRVYTKILTPRPVVALCPTIGHKYGETFMLDLDRNFFRMSDEVSSRNATRLVRMNQVQNNAYVGENVTFTCVAVRYLFANVHWGFVFQNGTTVLVSNGNEDTDSTEFRGIIQLRRTAIQMYDNAISQVGCYAPFGNSLEWAVSKQNISVQDQQPPSIMRSEVVEQVQLESTGRGTPLVCQVISHPPPNISWTYGNSQEIRGKFKINTNHTSDMNLISILTLYGQTEENEYDCMATNLFGSTKKRFQTYVSNRLHPGIILAIVVPVAIFVIIIFFLIRFHRIKLKKLENLLSEKDIKEFLEGQPEGDVHCESDPQSKAFPEEYRINREDLSFDPTAILGSGAYGIVWRGNLNKIGEQQSLDSQQYDNIGYTVAVKSVKPDAEIQHVKSLLTEIKTMVYTGTHQHIVTFLGACIQNIAQNEIYVALEFCDNGSLESYIRDRRDHFEETLDKTKVGQLNVPTLVRWSYEISQAMIHLAEKKLIHGDLATRNVLLTNSLTSKVSDFGLAKQLYNYSQYTRKGKMLLPWRWMAIESLRDMEFSTKSDVWSFGITLWEIFSLCEVPFGGLGYTLEYINMLKLGLRPMQPTLASNQIYGIMTQCWDSDSRKRPTIEVIGGMLSILRLENYDNKDSIVETDTAENLSSVAVINWKSPLETDDYAHYI